MSSLRQNIEETVGQAFAAQGLDPAFGTVMPSRRPDLGHFQCNGALAAAKAARRRPAEIAALAAETLRQSEAIARVTVDGPGFLNLSVSDGFLGAVADRMGGDPRLGCPVVTAPERVVLDFGGPNVAKAMHVGHLRSAIIGDCLQRLLRFVGHQVTSDVHLGDWGTQMGQLLCELARRRPDLPYFDAANSGPYPAEPPVTIDELGEMYPAASARAKADPEAARAARQATTDLQAGRPGYRALWKHFVDVSRAALERDYDALGVHFDLWLGESSVHDRIPPLLAELERRGLAVRSEGALVVEVAEPSDTAEVPPLILLKTDGAAMYGTTDLATIDQRVADLSAQRILYVVDKRQSLHFQQVFRAARRSGVAGAAELQHIPFGTMNGPDGKPFKTRAGGVVRLGDLVSMARDEARKRMDEAGVGGALDEAERDTITTRVALAAVKFADLAHDRLSDYVFQIEKFTEFEGCTGPYLLYAAVRVKAILRKAGEQGLAPGPVQPAHDAERALLLQLAQLPEAIAAAADARAPHLLCDFAYDLAKSFSRFYQSCPILADPDPRSRASRLSLARLFLGEMVLLLSCLGIDVPERM
jgi:arginyl-tRNA synthetase